MSLTINEINDCKFFKTQIVNLTDEQATAAENSKILETNQNSQTKAEQNKGKELELISAIKNYENNEPTYQSLFQT